MRPSVSVAICTHNGAAYIEEQLASIAAQTVPVSEIVLGDDASRDHTVDIAVAVAQAHGLPMRVLRASEPLGVTKNFERTILSCTHEFIALSDQDDVWHGDRIERALDAFAEAPHLALISGDAELIDAAGATLGHTLFEALGVDARHLRVAAEGNEFNLLMQRNLVTGATTMLRRELAVDAAPFPSSWVHDEWLAIIASARGEASMLPTPLIGYRQHGANAIGVKRLSILGKFGRMMERGALRSARLLARAESLADRLGDIAGVSPEKVLAAREKLEHERARSSLSTHRVLRAVPVIRELRTGRYHRFGRGVSDAVRDLLQPLTDHADT